LIDQSSSAAVSVASFRTAVVFTGEPAKLQHFYTLLFVRRQSCSFFMLLCSVQNFYFYYAAVDPPDTDALVINSHRQP